MGCTHWSQGVNERHVSTLTDEEQADVPLTSISKCVKVSIVDGLFLKVTFETRGPILPETDAANAGNQLPRSRSGKNLQPSSRFKSSTRCSLDYSWRSALSVEVRAVRADGISRRDPVSPYGKGRGQHRFRCRARYHPHSSLENKSRSLLKCPLLERHLLS